MTDAFDPGETIRQRIDQYDANYRLIAQERRLRPTNQWHEFDRDLIASLAFHVDHDTLVQALAEVQTVVEVRDTLASVVTLMTPELRARLAEGGGDE